MLLKPGTIEILPKPGYVLRLNEIYGRSTSYIEGLVGFSPGFLSDGWSLLYLIDSLGVDDFEMRGAAWFSDGVPRGHTLPKSVNRYPLQPERALQSQGWSEQDVRKYKLAQLSRLQTQGRERLVKVKSARPSPEDPAKYPPGTALGTWCVVASKRFWVQAAIAGNELSMGDPADLARQWREIIAFRGHL